MHLSILFQGISRETVEEYKKSQKMFETMLTGNLTNEDFAKAKPFYQDMAENIKIQRKRIGGNFAIAQAVTSQDMREFIRQFLPDCIFITLSLTREGQKNRVFARHGDVPGLLEMMTKLFDLYELPGDGEINTYNIDVDEIMNQADVLEKVMGTLDEHNKILRYVTFLIQREEG